jgi:hypothetical protein
MTEIALVVALVDETMSMSVIAGPTMDGFNSYFDELKQDTAGVETYVSLLKFSETRGEPMTRIVCENAPLVDMQQLTVDNYRPRGNTPLNDALADAINVTARGVKEKHATRVTLLVQTDGGENASRELSGWAGTEKVREMVEARKAEGWQVLFLGSDLPSTYHEAEMRGFNAGSTVSYSSVTGQSVFASAAQNTTRFSSGRASANTFTPQQKAKAGDKTGR